MNYPYSIRSVAEIHPAFSNNPNIRNVQLFQGINASNAIGTPVDPLAVIDAEATVKVLSGAQMYLPDVITDPIVETAKNRAHVLRETHASLEFGLQPAVGVFIQQQFINFQQQQLEFQEQLGHRLARMEATIANNRISSRNRRNMSDAQCPLQKYTAGDGHNLALVIFGGATLPPAAQDYQPNAAVGDVPNPWNPNVDAYELVDTLRLVIFYNDDFGINAGDLVHVMRQKVRAWLVAE